MPRGCCRRSWRQDVCFGARRTDARLCRPGPVWRSREQIPPHEGAGGGGRARVRMRSPETPSGAPWLNPRLASRQGQRPELRAATRSHRQHPTRVGAAACAAQTVHGPRRPRNRTRLCSAGRGLWTGRRASAGGTVVPDGRPPASWYLSPSQRERAHPRASQPEVRDAAAQPPARPRGPVAASGALPSVLLAGPEFPHRSLRVPRPP